MNLCTFRFRIRRDDIEDEDDQESYYNYMKNAPVVAYPDDDEELEYDSDGNPIAPEKSKVPCNALMSGADEFFGIT